MTALEKNSWTLNFSVFIKLQCVESSFVSTYYLVMLSFLTWRLIHGRSGSQGSFTLHWLKKRKEIALMDGQYNRETQIQCDKLFFKRIAGSCSIDCEPHARFCMKYKVWTWLECGKRNDASFKRQKTNIFQCEQLRRWLKCRGPFTSGNRIQQLERWEDIFVWKCRVKPCILQVFLHACFHTKFSQISRGSAANL